VRKGYYWAKVTLRGEKRDVAVLQIDLLLLLYRVKETLVVLNTGFGGRGSTILVFWNKSFSKLILIK
jgi:hypothetical protein